MVNYVAINSMETNPDAENTLVGSGEHTANIAKFLRIIRVFYAATSYVPTATLRCFDQSVRD